MANLRITVLGCDGAYPSVAGACSGYLVRTDTTSIWLDAGTGTLANLQLYMEPQDLDAVVLTHEHVDHCANVGDFYVLCKVADRQVRHIPVYAAPGVRKRIFNEDTVEPHLSWTELDAEHKIEIGDMSLRFARTDHGPVTLAVRVDSDGQSFAYSSDTGPKWSFASLGNDVDVAFIEAALRIGEEGDATRHLSPRQAAVQATEANVSRLVLTHLKPDHDHDLAVRQCAATFGRPVELARAGETYAI